jgi:hypothetical protein
LLNDCIHCWPPKYWLYWRRPVLIHPLLSRFPDGFHLKHSLQNFLRNLLSLV